jgi:hypothetical protein
LDHGAFRFSLFVMNFYVEVVGCGGGAGTRVRASKERFKKREKNAREKWWLLSADLAAEQLSIPWSSSLVVC